MGVHMDNEGDMREARAVLFNVNSRSGWILLDWAGSSTIHFDTGGEEGLSELIPNLRDDEIQYALYRIGNIPDGYRTTVRDVFITIIGSRVSSSEISEKKGYLDDVKWYLEPFHSEVVVKNKYNLTDDS